MVSLKKKDLVKVVPNPQPEHSPIVLGKKRRKSFSDHSAAVKPAIRRRATSVILFEEEGGDMVGNWTDQIFLRRDARGKFVAIAKKYCEDHTGGRGRKRWVEIDRVVDLKNPAQVVAGLNRCSESIGIDIEWDRALEQIAKIDWCASAVMAIQIGHVVPLLPTLADMAAQRSLKTLGKVKVCVEWGYDLHEVNIPTKTWLNILLGKAVSVDTPYQYEGQQCHATWSFNVKAKNQLRVFIDDGGDGWLGDFDDLTVLRGPEIDGVDLAKAALAAAQRLKKLRVDA